MKEMHLPALRCLMGEWLYYTASMTLKEVAERVTFADKVYASTSLGELLQRQLRGERTKKIADYLLQEPERFLGALVVAVNGGDPSWLELDVKPSDHLNLEALPTVSANRLERTVGFLRLSGQEELWALDGQHRLAGIQEAVKLNPAISTDAITVIFVGHEDTPDGREQTRRLFTTLNRNAKAISPGERIALDEDDACAILTRRLVENHPLLSGDRVAGQEKGQLSPLQTEPFTVITTIYNICARLLDKREVMGQRWAKDKLLDGRRPTDGQLDALYAEVSKFWDGLPKAFPEVKAYMANQGKDKALPYRRADGGNLLFRPIGLDSYSRAFRKLLDTGATPNEAFRALTYVPSFNFEDDLWAGLLWLRAKPGVNPKAANRDIAAEIMVYKSGGTVDRVKLLERYRKAVDNPEAELP